MIVTVTGQSAGPLHTTRGHAASNSAETNTSFPGSKFSSIDRQHCTVKFGSGSHPLLALQFFWVACHVCDLWPHVTRMRLVLVRCAAPSTCHVFRDAHPRRHVSCGLVGTCLFVVRSAFASRCCIFCISSLTSSEFVPRKIGSGSYKFCVIPRKYRQFAVGGFVKFCILEKRNKQVLISIFVLFFWTSVSELRGICFCQKRKQNIYLNNPG